MNSEKGVLDDSDRRAIDRLKRDQEYRARLNAQRASLWNKAAIVATLLGGAAGVAALVAVLLHL